MISHLLFTNQLRRNPKHPYSTNRHLEMVDVPQVRGEQEGDETGLQGGGGAGSWRLEKTRKMIQLRENSDIWNLLN